MMMMMMIYKNIITMHGTMNVKYSRYIFHPRRSKGFADQPDFQHKGFW
jgi:hypothetical protein